MPPTATAAASRVEPPVALRPAVKVVADTPLSQRNQRALQQQQQQQQQGALPAHPSTPPRFTLGNKNIIGSGSFGTVYRALDLTNNRMIAVKELRLQHVDATDAAAARKETETLEREIRVMAKLSHPNIVKYYGYTRGEGTFNILMEYVPCGSISSLLRSFKRFEPVQVALFTKQILLGLEYLHTRMPPIAHRDLKGDNLFVDTEHRLKIGDFGTAKELQTISGTGGSSLAGTAYFMAPEVIRSNHHGREADVWAVGCCVIQMLTGEPPYKAFDTHIAVMFQVTKGDIESQIPASAPDAVKDFIRACCRLKPSARPTVSELLQHPWMVATPDPAGSVTSPPSAAPAVGTAPPPSGIDLGPPSGAPATRAHQSRPTETPPRPPGSGKQRTLSTGREAARSREGRPSGASTPVRTEPPPASSGRSQSITDSPPPPVPGRPQSKEPASSNRGVAAARKMRQQSDRPGGAASGSRGSATPTKRTDGL
jgi:serine/threonine protein kinase